MFPELPPAQVGEYCRAWLHLVSVTQENETLISFILSPREDGRATDSDAAVIYGSYLDGRWVFSWPVALDPKLHGRRQLASA